MKLAGVEPANDYLNSFSLRELDIWCDRGCNVRVPTWFCPG
jgi:hypothetical protein